MIAIFKIQAPLGGTEEPMYLAYNEDKSAVLKLEITNEMKALMNGRPKAYFKCKHRGKKFKILKPVRDREW